jgi:4-carboxymuconolactone decarboxylase
LAGLLAERFWFLWTVEALACFHAAMSETSSDMPGDETEHRVSPGGIPDLAATARWLEGKYGFVSNLAQTMAHSPGALMPWLDLENYCRYQSDLTERQRMIIILIAVRDVHYCWPHYRPMAGTVGLSEDQISLIRQGRVPQDIAEVEQVVCQVANEIVAGRRVPQAMYEDIVKLLPPRQIVDIAILASFYLAMGALSTGLCVEVETPEILRQEQIHHKKAIGLA